MLESLGLNSSMQCKPLSKWAFNAPPRLRALFLTGNSAIPAPDGLAIDWNSLTELTAFIDLGGAPHYHVPFQILASCKSLLVLNCTYVIILDDGIQASGQDLCHFPFLEQLTVSTGAIGIRHLLDSITTPALKRLKLNVSLPEDPEVHWTAAVVELVKRSSFNLTEVILDASGDEDDNQHIADMLGKLSLSNSIKKLKMKGHLHAVSFVTLSDPLLFWFTTNLDSDEEHQAEHLPMLSEFIYNGDILFSLAAASQMLNSRLEYDKSREEKRGPDDSIPPRLTMTINYQNIDWYRDQNPNDMQKSYHVVEKFSTEGRQFKLQYDDE